jgi:hypothetical protein
MVISGIDSKRSGIGVEMTSEHSLKQGSAAWLSPMCPEGIGACWSKSDQGKPQPAAPHFSPTGTG